MESGSYRCLSSSINNETVDALCASAVRLDFDDLRIDLYFVAAFDEMPPVEYANALVALKEGLRKLLSRPMEFFGMLVHACAIERAFRFEE